MRAISIAGAIALATSFGSAADAQLDWRALTLPEDRKPLVYFPGAYGEKTDSLTTIWGPTPIRRYYYNDPEGTSGNRLYTLAIVDYPKGSLPADSTARRQALFEETLAAARESVNGELMFSNALEGSSIPGYVFRIDYNEGSKSVYNRAFFVADRYYHLQVFSIKGDEGIKSRERFFENFRPVVARGAAAK